MSDRDLGQSDTLAQPPLDAMRDDIFDKAKNPVRHVSDPLSHRRSADHWFGHDNTAANVSDGSALKSPIAMVEIIASFEFRVGGLPGQARAQARRSERLTRVG
jgi:hypothetical protein